MALNGGGHERGTIGMHLCNILAAPTEQAYAPASGNFIPPPLILRLFLINRASRRQPLQIEVGHDDRLSGPPPAPGRAGHLGGRMRFRR